MSRYKPYPKYKDSGIEWLGEVPEAWSIFQLKRSVDGCTNGIWGNEPDELNDLCVLRVADFNRENFSLGMDKLTKRAILEKERTNRLLKHGDLLIEKSGGGDNQLVGTVVQFTLDFQAVTSNFVAKMTPLKGFHSRFLTYAFAHLYSRRVNYQSIKQTTGIQNLDSEQYLSGQFCFPNFDEQTNIANFLDRETAKIDGLIAKQERMIELLGEKRQALISHAVTKGLDPSVKMKDSGALWLGEVPRHWKVKQGKYLGKILTTPSLSDDSMIEDGSIQYVKVDDLNNMDSNLFLTHTKQYTAPHIDGVRPIQNFICFPKRGAAIFTNKACIIVNESMIDPNLMAWKIYSEHSQKFVLYSLLSRKLDDIADVSTVPQINNKHIEPIFFPAPPLPEQIIIVKYLDTQTAKIDTLIQKAKQAIELLKERRTALICAAVTGKIDVRDAL